MEPGESGAICVRCGASRGDFRDICPSCGHRPEGEGLLVAWLFSQEALSQPQLAKAAERVRKGEPISPSDRMLDRARTALGMRLASDPGLTTGQRLGLLATTLFATPLVGWVVWFWWRRTRPRAALQALALSAPASVVLFVLVIWLRLR